MLFAFGEHPALFHHCQVYFVPTTVEQALHSKPPTVCIYVQDLLVCEWRALETGWIFYHPGISGAAEFLHQPFR